MTVLAQMRSFVARSAKIATPITAICGIVADLGSTVARFSLYLLLVSLGLAVLSGLLWFAKYRRDYRRALADGVLQPEEVAQLEERNVWSVLFAFSVVAAFVMAGFVIAEKLWAHDGKGVVATVVPGMDKVQAALFRVEHKLDAVQADTTAIRTDTSRLVASVDEMAKRFDALSSTVG